MDFIFSRFKLLKTRLKSGLVAHLEKERAYIKKLVFPLKLFPLKLIVYFFYYPIRISFKILLWSIKLIYRTVIYPFRSFKNFFKSVVLLALLTYIAFSFIAIFDYIRRNYGHYSKFLCGIGIERELENKVVRILGEYAEGSGFFFEEDKVVTNFHVIEGEPSPKIVLPGGSILTPVKITGNRDFDIAILETAEKRPDYVLPLMDQLTFYPNEPLVSAGYALGSGLLGEPTFLKGRFVSYRDLSGGYIQTDINLVEGMSGGPLLEQCGQVVGINTMGLSGLSLFIPSFVITDYTGEFTDQDITKIEVDTETPEGVVNAFYTYIKARDLQKAYNLLSGERKAKITSFEDWTRGYTNTLHVSLIGSRVDETNEDLVEIKIESSDWLGGRLIYKFFQGTWEVVEEDGELKLNESNITQVEDPDHLWFYYWEDEFE